MTSTPPSKPLRLGPFFGLRTPLLPLDDYLAWTEGLTSPEAWEDEAALGAALESDKLRLRERMRLIVQRPEVREALYLASPDLEESLDRWLAEPEGEKGQRTELALVRYFQRMVHRCTPFGLFAGHSFGRAGESTSLALEPREANRRTTRLDMDYLTGLVDALEKDHALRETLTYRPNSSLYRASGSLRYVEFTKEKDKGRKYKLVSVKSNETLEAILVQAGAGATLAALAEPLVDEETPHEACLEFLHELVDAQILVPDLEPTITGEDPTPALVARLERSKSTEAAGRHLRTAQELLAQLDGEGLGHAPSHYRKLAAELEALPAKVDLSKLLMVNMEKPTPQAQLGEAVRQAVEEGAALMARLAPRGMGEAMGNFAEAFTKRYESRWVPLVEALDAEQGIGFGAQAGSKAEAAPLLDGLAFPGRGGHAHGNGGPTWNRRDIHVYRQLIREDVRRTKRWELSEADLKALDEGGPERPLADSMSTIATLSAPSRDALAQGDFQVHLQGIFGPSSARLLGRFCPGDTQLTAAVEAALREEEAYRPDAVFAEIVHLGQGRMGNVLARPALRPYEIVFLGRGSVPESHQILVSDLLVSVVAGRVVLWSKRLNKEVVPRLSSAANFQFNALDLYRFLGTLQMQGITANLSWSWDAHEQEAFLPRVTHGRFILSRATWNLSGAELKPLVEAKEPQRYRAAQALRRKHELPRFTLFAEGDNELLVDWDNPLSLATFGSVVKGRGGIRLVEDLSREGELLAQGPEGGYTHELVLPFSRVVPENAKAPAALAGPTESSNAIQGRFAPGSEWLFLKLYGGQSSGDWLLTETLAPLIPDLKARGLIDGWFFIRYGDPDPHLRLRFHGDPGRLHGLVLPELHERLSPLLQDGSLWRLELSTYERELERYGGPANIDRMEALFQVDSEAVLELVKAYPGDAGAILRWQLTLAGMDGLLKVAGLDLERRHAFAKQAREDFGREYGVKGSSLEKQLGDRFRTERQALSRLLFQEPDPEHPSAKGLAILTHRDQRIDPLLKEVEALREAGKLSLPFDELLRSLLHMFVNRSLRSAQRPQECVLYDFLERLYESQLARSRKEAKSRELEPA